MSVKSSKEKIYKSTSQYGDIYLQIDQTTYQPGDTITGTIYLNLISSYPGNQLYIKLKGKEVGHFVVQEGDRNNRHLVRRTVTNHIIHDNILAHHWGSISPRQLSLPFSFRLPDSLPSSFHQEGYGYSLFLEYQVQAFLQPYESDGPKQGLKYLPFSLQTQIHYKSL